MQFPKKVAEYFRKEGAKGGQARAAKYGFEQLSEWGKKGGRPKGSGKKKRAAREAKSK